jgi:NAD-dependent deacetylase
MHGELNKARCERECGEPPVEDHAIYSSLAEVGRCSCGGRLRPHIVFFGEIPLEMDRIEEEIAKATVMVVVGTSGSVYPAANFVHWANQGGARTVYIGPEPPLNAHAFTHVVQGKAGEVLPGLFRVE